MKPHLICTLVLVSISIGAVLATDKLRGVKPSSTNIYQGDFIECDGGKKVPINRVNDDFCDCADGTDEPGTSACPRGQFFCANAGFRGSSIPSSWVDDKRCDCCDGSDESKVSCPNTCEEAAKKHKEKVAAEIAITERGLVLREAYVSHAQSERVRHLQLIEETEAKQGALEAKVAELEKVKIAAEESYSTIHDQVTERVAAEHDAKEAEKKEAEEEEKENGQDKSREDDLLDVDEDPQVKPLKEEKERAVQAWTDAKNAHDALNRELEGYRKFVNLDFGNEGAFHALYGSPIEFSDKEYTYKLDAFNEIRQSKTGHSSSLGRWKGWDQSKPNVMLYENGDRCWGAPDRSTKVILICGDENKVIDVKEPNKCEYSMTVKTPAACSKAILEEL